MWGDLIITVKKPDSLPTDALSGQATGSRDLEVPLKVCVLMCPLDLVCLKIPPPGVNPRPHPILCTVPPSYFQFHLGISFVLFCSVRSLSCSGYSS